MTSDPVWQEVPRTAVPCMQEMPKFACFASREELFASLPESLRRHYNLDPTVHIWVTAFLYGRVKREEMLEGLVAVLADQKAHISAAYLKFAEWFGTPPGPIIVEPEAS